MSLISREYNCFIVLFEKYKIGRKIQALSAVIILCHRLTSAFPFLLKLASGSDFLSVEKKFSPARRFLWGLGIKITHPSPTPEVHLKLLHSGGGPPLSWRSPLALAGLHHRRSEGLEVGGGRVALGGLWQQEGRDQALGKGR